MTWQKTTHHKMDKIMKCKESIEQSSSRVSALNPLSCFLLMEQFQHAFQHKTTTGHTVYCNRPFHVGHKLGPYEKKNAVSVFHCFLIPLAVSGLILLNPSCALWPVQNWMMAYSYLLNGICTEVLHCGLDERLLMLISLPTTVSPTSPQAGRFFIV